MSPAATLAAITETYNQIQPLAAHSITGTGGRLRSCRQTRTCAIRK
jgi:hypothetical protein